MTSSANLRRNHGLTGGPVASNRARVDCQIDLLLLENCCSHADIVNKVEEIAGWTLGCGSAGRGREGLNLRSKVPRCRFEVMRGSRGVFAVSARFRAGARVVLVSETHSDLPFGWFSSGFLGFRWLLTDGRLVDFSTDGCSSGLATRLGYEVARTFGGRGLPGAPPTCHACHEDFAPRQKAEARWLCTTLLECQSNS